MSLRNMWTITFNVTTGNGFAFPASVLLAVAFFLGCETTGRGPPQLDHSGIRLTITFPEWGRNHSNSEVVLTFSNLAAQPRTIVLPVPLNENATEIASPDRPTLVLVVKEPSMADDEAEGFVLAEFGERASGPSKAVTLKPGESAQVAYPLASFYLWGHAGPQELDGFLKLLRPGEREVTVRALIAYSESDFEEPRKGEPIQSPPVVLKCAFPERFFRTKE